MLLLHKKVLNKKLLERAREINSLYSSQPKRVCCKLCRTTLLENPDFSSYGVDYVFCEKCSHLNGIYEDTEAFVNSLYISDSGKGYASNYLDKSFEKRTIEVYLLKVDVFISILSPKTKKNSRCGLWQRALRLRSTSSQLKNHWP